MNAHRLATTFAIAALVVAGLVGGASADISKKVQAAFRGQLLITEEPLPESAGSDKDTIALYKKATLKSLKGTPGEEDALTWRFAFTAFFKAPPRVTELSVDFYTNDKEKLYVAKKRLSGVDANLTVLTGEVSIDELIAAVGIALDPASDPTICAGFDPNLDGQITINELVQFVGSALDGCDVGPTPTATLRSCTTERAPARTGSGSRSIRPTDAWRRSRSPSTASRRCRIAAASSAGPSRCRRSPNTPSPTSTCRPSSASAARCP